MPPDLTTLFDSLEDVNISEISQILPSKYYDIEDFKQLANTKNSKCNISIFNTNCRSLPKNKSSYDLLFETLSENSNFYFDVLTFCETWLSPDLEQLVNFSGYSKTMKHKSTVKGGGLAIYVKENLHYIARNDINVRPEFENLFDCLFIQINRKPNDIVIGVISVPQATAPYQHLMNLF